MSRSLTEVNEMEEGDNVDNGQVGGGDNEDDEDYDSGEGDNGGDDDEGEDGGDEDDGDGDGDDGGNDGGGGGGGGGDDDGGQFEPMQDHELPENHLQPIYHNAPLSLIQSYLLTHHHFNRFQPSREEKESVLRLLAFHCFSESLCFQSLYNFENFLGNGLHYSQVHEYCHRCHRHFQQGEAHCPQPNCDALRYEGNAEDQVRAVLKSFFITFDLTAELKTRFLGNSLSFFSFFFFFSFLFLFFFFFFSFFFFLFLFSFSFFFFFFFVFSNNIKSNDRNTNNYYH